MVRDKTGVDYFKIDSKATLEKICELRDEDERAELKRLKSFLSSLESNQPCDLDEVETVANRAPTVERNLEDIKDKLKSSTAYIQLCAYLKNNCNKDINAYINNIENTKTFNEFQDAISNKGAKGNNDIRRNTGKNYYGAFFWNRGISTSDSLVLELLEDLGLEDTKMTLS